jgi:hypothetical protein
MLPAAHAAAPPALPDVHAVVFHVSALAADARSAGGGGADARDAPPALGVAAFVARLRLARVRVAALVTADAAAQLEDAAAAAAPCVATLSAGDDGGASRCLGAARRSPATQPRVLHLATDAAR